MEERTVSVSVHIATEFSPELLAALHHLVPQLSSTASPVTEAELRAILDADATTLLVAVEGDRIVGTLTLVLFPIPTGVRAWIEDVIVDESVRGQGVGELLTNFAITRAQERGAKSVDLTSRPTREAANRLYVRAGFELRETNVYRFSLEG